MARLEGAQARADVTAVVVVVIVVEDADGGTSVADVTESLKPG
eukprot:CAMPEP_0180594660 /NCGR_PEP_ID=MMETSP1037_2-20121125/20890_1 /TAXON_ID=632150 /ORGANISM="Azadinium spinosum, Strain 3D9" /LENGTH=42 /DNA_ID= /DNA_START= /DNA_END= /DNA_ORIENTATION=